MDVFEPGEGWMEKRERLPVPSSDAKFALHEMADDWHFFNHGALFEYTTIDTDPVGDWYAQQEPGTRVIRTPFKRPVIEGLTRPTALGVPWGHVICGVRNHDWEDLFPFLGGVVALDSKDKDYFQLFSGDIEIVDPGEAQRHSVWSLDLPKITVTVFCVDGMKDRWQVTPSVGGMPPRFYRVDPRQEVIDMGQAVLSGDMEHLQYKDNPAFKPLQDKFKSIVTPGEASNEALHRAAQQNRGKLDLGGR